MPVKNAYEILPHVTAKVKEVGRFVRSERRTLRQTHISRKTDGSVVSKVDKEAEEKLVEELSKLLPEAGFLTEEKTVPSQPYEDWVWIVDPIDGTFNFVHDVAPYCVNVGLTYHGDIVLGVTYEVLRDECFYAVKKHGAFCNERPIQVSTCQDFSCALIGLGFSNRREKLDQFLSVLNILSQRGVGFRRTGSVAANMAYVACGRFEGLLGVESAPWDLTPGTLLVREAKGTVTGLHGRDIKDDNGNLLAAGGLHNKLLNILNKHHLEKKCER